MAKVPLLCGAFALVDDDDLDLVLRHRWRIQWRYASGKRVRPQSVVSGSGGDSVLLHRLLMGVEGMVVDHINGDPLDNRRANLRNCSSAENALNRRIHRKFQLTSALQGAFTLCSRVSSAPDGKVAAFFDVTRIPGRLYTPYRVLLLLVTVIVSGPSSVPGLRAMKPRRCCSAIQASSKPCAAARDMNSSAGRVADGSTAAR